MKPQDILANEALLDELVRLLSEARQTIDDIASAPVCTGYIFAKRREGEADSGDAPPKREDLLYEDFHPFIPSMFMDDPAVRVLEFQGYNQTVDEFFSSLEGQKLETRLNQRGLAAKRKLEAATQDQAKRVEGLQEAQAMNLRRAAAIEANVEHVQETMDAINGLVAQGMDWIDIGKLVEREKNRHNPVAEIIVLPLRLAENIVSLKLAEEEPGKEEEEDPYETDSSGSEEGDAEAARDKSRPIDKGLVVEINLTLSPWSNAREYYDQKRSAAAKEEKTQMQAIKALKSAEQKINDDLKKGLKQEKALLQPIRNQLWFEKFTWFISSDGYLVLGGKDPVQNELLYRKALRKGDIYCHADLRGAPSVVIKNNPKTPDAPIPPATLSQAGSLAVCSSDAWDSKACMGAWWVKAEQVSKSAPTGEFLSTGAFAVRGEKNFLPPTQLLLGLGVMFKISEESKARHVKHRLDGDDRGGEAPAEGRQSQQTETQRNAAASERLEGDQETVADNATARADNDDASDLESVEEPEVDPGRDNPLQAFDGGHGDGPQAMEDSMARLEFTEQPRDFDTEHETAEVPVGGPGGETPPEPAMETSEIPETEVEQSSSPLRGSTTGKKPPPKRGQKGKAKKIASKYKDQDEEDRAAAEALIGAAVGKQRAEAEAKARAEAQAELEAARERRRAQHQRQQRQTAEHEEARRAMMDEGIDRLEGGEAEQATGLDVLVGTPLPGDDILEALPVCAPWSALAKVKYKAKMQPGATKKGKAVKEVMERWRLDSAKKGAVDETARDSERMWPREVELLKGLKAEEAINCVPVGKVRVMMAGGGGGGGAKGKGTGKGPAKSGRGGRGSKRQ